MELDLPKIGFGGAPIGGLLNFVDDKEAVETVKIAIKSGIRYFDTAPFYGFGLSEHRLGEVLRDRRDVILSSKVGRLLKPGLPEKPASYGWPRPLPFHPVFDYGYDAVMRSYEDSLQRLGRDKIDILFLHDIGSFTHSNSSKERQYFEDAMAGGYKALDELRQSGDVKAIGIGVNEIDVSLRALDYGKWDIFLLAGRYTLLEQRSALQELFPKCASKSVKIIIGGPFNSGILVGGKTWNYENAPKEVIDKAHKLAIVCKSHCVPMPAAALRFPLAHPAVKSVIPGCRNPQEFKQLMEWWNTKIPTELWSDLKSQELIDQIAPVPGA